MSDGAWNDPAVRQAVQEVIAATPKPSYCGMCGKECSYQANYFRAWWVHSDTGNHMSTDPEKHDCNTYIVREANDA